MASVLGAKMRGAAATMLKVEDFSAQVDAAIEMLRRKLSVTDEEIKSIKETYEGTITRVPNLKGLGVKSSASS